MKRITLKPAVKAVAETLHAGLFNYMQRAGLIACVAHVGVSSFTGNQYYISATLPATYDQAGYESTDVVFTEITDVQDFPGYGPKRATGTFTPIDGPIAKYVGAPNYGSGAFTCADEPTDGGQVICKAAAATSGTHHSIKVLAPDGEIDYLDVIVAGWELSAAKENTPRLRSGTLEVCKAIVNVAAP